ncbi:hypothetical protein J4461_03340 [Candidatus Pacearchaeota archaeon]|nr:hypothetical protein [Candidatus Pacearchaeota archaeon]
MKNYKIFAVLIISIFLIASVSTLGITPGRVNQDFIPGVKQTFKVTVINSEQRDVNLAVKTRGELAGIIELRENEFSMKSSEREREISFDVILPDTLTPGLHTAEVVVSQLPSNLPSSPATVGLSLAVATQIHIYSPYPGKYIEGNLKVSGSESQKNLYLSLTSRGKENIERAKATINIFNAGGESIKQLETQSVSLSPGERKEIGAVWNVDASRGRYTAKAVLNYDGQNVLYEEQFEVGELALDILNLFVTDFTLGGIAKFNLLIHNKWSEPINSVYAQMRVLDSSFSEIADVKSATYDIPSGERTTLVYYWDTKDLREGLYNANILLNYADKKTQQDVKLDVSKDSIQVIGLGRVISTEEKGTGGNKTITILIVIIGFLVVLNILWFVVLRKRRMRNSR